MPSRERLYEEVLQEVAEAAQTYNTVIRAQLPMRFIIASFWRLPSPHDALYQICALK